MQRGGIRFYNCILKWQGMVLNKVAFSHRLS